MYNIYNIIYMYIQNDIPGYVERGLFIMRGI